MWIACDSANQISEGFSFSGISTAEKYCASTPMNVSGLCVQGENLVFGNSGTWDQDRRVSTKRGNDIAESDGAPELVAVSMLPVVVRLPSRRVPPYTAADKQHAAGYFIGFPAD